jgi:hypothetical protein
MEAIKTTMTKASLPNLDLVSKRLLLHYSGESKRLYIVSLAWPRTLNVWIRTRYISK